MILRGLVLTQPWGTACIELGKDIENRKRSLKHRGPLVIVAGASKGRIKDWDEFCSAVRWIRHATDDLKYSDHGFHNRWYPTLERGGIIGCVEMYDVVTPEQFPATPWHMPGQYGYRIRNAVALPFRPLKGHQGLMNIEMTPKEIRAIEAGGIACKGA